MTEIRIVNGVGSASTALASYDAALADANVHNYNLVKISSIIPPEASVTVSGTAPKLGESGDLLYIVKSRITTATSEQISAGLGWGESANGEDVIHEAAGCHSESEIVETLRESLVAVKGLRGYEFAATDYHTLSVRPGADDYTTVIVSAAYGTATTLF